MASIKEATEAAKQFNGEQITPTAAPAVAPTTNEQPGKNPFLRCALPTIWKSDPDALRQFSNPTVPQSRIFTPITPTVSGNVSETNYISGGLGGSGGGSSTVNISPNANNTFNDTYLTTTYTTQCVVKTPHVTPGSSYTGITIMTQSFQLLSIAASSPCRVRLYGTLGAQNADLSRGLDDPCPAGVSNLITDIALDTTPLSWQWQNRIAANGDEPQTGNVYITVENLSNATSAITLTIQYVPLSQGNSPNSPTVSVGNATISNSMLATWNGVAMLSGAQFTGPIESYNVISGQISAVNISATGSTTVTDLTASGNITTTDLTINGSLALTDISANDITAVNITSTGSVTANDFSSSGNITVNEVISNSVNSPIVNVSSGAAGLTINGTQISSSTLSDAANLPTLSGANVFTAPITAASFTASDSGSVSVFAGEVQSASFTQTSGSSSVNNFLGPVNVVDIVSTGGTTLVTINGFLPPTTDNADQTLKKVITQSAVSGTTFTFTLAELTSTGVSFSVTSAGTSDVFNLNGEMLYKVSSGTNGAFLVALVGGVIGSAFGFGIDNIPSTSGPSTCVFTGSTTGLSAGTHNITLYFASMVLVSGSPTIQVAGGVTNLRCQGQLQQISE